MLRSLLTLAGMLVLASVVSAQDALLRAFRTTDSDARGLVFTAVSSGAVSLSSQASIWTAASPQQRVHWARAAIAFARTVTSTADFRQRYAIFRAGQRPQPPAMARTGDEARHEQQRQIALAIKQAQDRASSLPPTARQQLESEIASMRQQVDVLNADPSYRAAVDAAAREASQQADAEFKSQVASFEQKYPANLDTLIARRLQRFLDMCGDVDYDALLQQSADQKRRFVDSRFEQKSAEWKMCYRAGRPTVDAARAAAQEWLKVLVQ
jgi:hypothetical protein